ncbi:hypothetical protein [Psychroserpens sp. NJDZ02]|uniref:hypothetical protein n=1 Tax=Psychroserpens sp. NJDZ02 TaxID=2570561 RepID=UPI0010A887F6|nr:hypothetical protein [Psychroserpens sp. NJDZ02]QCE42325.1 hypothetical protein E9099_13240 [Psychroserpens sp. NJDZ02]
MGFNIAGLLIKGQTDDAQINSLLESKIAFYKTVSFEEATSSLRDDNTVDILQTKTGTLIITELGQIYDISTFEKDIIQFMISDVSDTYYFEKYTNGKLDRKYIYSQGEIQENEGQGIIKEDDDVLDLIWEFTDVFLQNDFMENRFEQKFKRYKL